MKPVIVIINGPNLNLLGKRQPEIYGNTSFEDYMIGLRTKFSSCYLTYHQSNHEGDLIDWLHLYGFDCKGIVLNAGAFTHTSIAIGDAIASIDVPVAEVHISDIYQREDFRKLNFIKDYCAVSFVGEGLVGYDKAIDFLLSNTI